MTSRNVGFVRVVGGGLTVFTTVNRVLSTLRGSVWQLMPRKPQLAGRGGFASRVVILAGGTALGQAVTIVAAPLLTRLYSPTDYGILAVYVSILTSVIGIASLRFHLALPVARDDETVTNLLALSLLVVTGMTALLGIGLWLVGSALVEWTQTPDLARYLWLLPLSFIAAGTYQVLNTWAIRNNLFGSLARTKVGQGVGLVTTQVGLGLLRVGPAGLLIGDAVGRACGSLTLLRLMWTHHWEHRGSLSFARIRQVASRYRRFPLISSPSALLSNLRGQAPTLLLASFYGGQVVGWFALGQRMLTVTFFLVASSVGDVYLNESARLAREDPTQLMPFFWRTLRRSALIVVPLLGTLAIVGPWVFGPLFGGDWTEAGRYVRVLAIVSLSDFLVRSVGSTLSVLERQDLDLVADFLAIALTCGPLIVGGTLGASPFMSLVFFAIGGSIAGIINLTLVWYAIRHASDKKDGRRAVMVAGE